MYNFDIECIESRRFLESIFHLGVGSSRPLFSIFSKGERRMALMCRETTDYDDKMLSFQEIFSFIVTMKDSEEVFFALDQGWVGTSVEDLFTTDVTALPQRGDIYHCVTMHRGDSVARFRSLPYLKDKFNNLFYVISSALPGTVELGEGVIINLLKVAFETTDSPYESHAEHARALAELGHAVALYPYGDRGGPKFYS